MIWQGYFGKVTLIQSIYNHIKQNQHGRRSPRAGQSCSSLLRLHGSLTRTRTCQYLFAHADFGAAYGTAKAGTGISSISIWRPGVVMKSLIPVVMAGILGIYGMIVAVIISQRGIFPQIQSSTLTSTPSGTGFPIWLRDWYADSVVW